MSTTTPDAIITVLTALVVAATPDLHVADRFKAHRFDNGITLEEWATSDVADCLRRFSIRSRLDTTVPDVCDGTQERVRQTFDVAVAYPTKTNRYVNAIGLDKIIAADLRKLRGTVGYAGFPLIYADHANLCTVLSESSDLVVRGDVVTFATLELTIEFWRTLL